MKKILVFILLSMMLTLAACGQKSPAAETPQSTAAVQLANPWHDITEAEAREICPRSFVVPEGAENVNWCVMDSAADPSGVPGALVQLSFDLNGNSFTAREQVTGGTEIDQSGMYYDWTVEDESDLQFWADGKMPCKTYRYFDENGFADLCTWYDKENGVSYSLSVTAKDLDGFDLRAVAGAMYG
ncbi:MAG: hypothetical protein IKO83_06925 [Oscillospiraceae bacterium]|nr:hypothetical protein [Oscillospiraceae bacterium]